MVVHSSHLLEQEYSSHQPHPLSQVKDSMSLPWKTFSVLAQPLLPVWEGHSLLREGHSIHLLGELKYSTHQHCPQGLQGYWLLLLQIYSVQWVGLPAGHRLNLSSDFSFHLSALALVCDNILNAAWLHLSHIVLLLRAFHLILSHPKKLPVREVELL